MDLARRFVWRAGRKMYMWARKDEPNEIATNGENRLQRLVVDAIESNLRIIAFDVGARIGEWSRSLMTAAASHQAGLEIHAFEPVPESRNQIAQSFAPQISAGQLRVNVTALSDDIRKVPIYVPHTMGGTSTLHPDTNVQYQEIFEVETTTVSEYCRAHSIDHVDLLKVDTEGNDLRVIRGAGELIRRGAIRVLQFEYNHRWVYSRSFLKDVFDFIEDSPYYVSKICSDAVEIYVEWHPELERYFETNYALVHRDFVDELKCSVFRIGNGNACERIVLTG
jgi:FkbM family methyltransferase